MLAATLDGAPSVNARTHRASSHGAFGRSFVGTPDAGHAAMRTLLLALILSAGCATDPPPPPPTSDLDLAIEPAALVFPDTIPGTLSPPSTLTVTNVSTEVITPFSVGTLGWNGFTDDAQPVANFKVTTDGCKGVALEPGQQCQFELAMAPTRTGAIADRSGVISWSVYVDGKGSATSAISGKGITVPGAQLGVDKPAIDLGPVVIFERTAHIDVTVTNTGTAPSFTLDPPKLTGDPDFAIYGDTCKHRSLLAGESCQIGVWMLPSRTGSLSGTLHITAPDVSLTVALTGTSLDP